MPPPQGYSRQDHKTLRLLLDSTRDTINECHLAWQMGAFDSNHVQRLTSSRNNMIKILAHHRDKVLLLDVDTIELMCQYEELAGNLLEGAAQLTAGDARKEEAIKTPTGNWAVSRRLLINDKSYEHALVVTNPAVAQKQLDEWEQKLRQSVV